MLASWFERGLGQIVAPDDKAPVSSNEDDDGFWNVVAPKMEQEDRERRDGPPPSASLSPLPPGTSKVQCVHCHNWTPVAPKTPSPRDSTPLSEGTPSTLNGLVLSAAKETAESMISPPAVAEARNKVFRLCASSQPLSDKLCHRLKRLIQQDPALITARASHFGNLVPDGYTPLMAAAAANHVVAAKIILEEAPEAVLEVDLQGRTALHIAAELGCMGMVDLLKTMHPEGPDAPVDLTGHTPLGRAITSQHKGAKQNHSQLKEKLFSPGDVSVCGRPTPAKTRSSQLDLQLVYGYSDMPGLRVMMEDAISCHVWHGHALLGVCDGHGDHGCVSKFVADGMADILQKQLSDTDDVAQAWKTACLVLDAQLKDSGRKGGSTAVWALVTETSITVANVGDSRCILIQKPSLEQAMENLKLQEEKVESPEKTEAEEKQSMDKQLRYIVTPLSEDHKPNLELEQARIEKAGLSVVAETFMEDGVEQTIYKVQRSETDRLAVSRSFGDFEYKGITELAADEQAVVATPEIRVHARDKGLDMYLVLACDGVWDVMSSQEVADFVVSRVEAAVGAEEEGILPRVGDELLNECLQRGSTDNMTTVIVALSKTAESIGGCSVLEGKALDFQAE